MKKILYLLLLVFTFVACDSPSSETQTDIDLLYGTWEATSVTYYEENIATGVIIDWSDTFKPNENIWEFAKGGIIYAWENGERIPELTTSYATTQKSGRDFIKVSYPQDKILWQINSIDEENLVLYTCTDINISELKDTWVNLRVTLKFKKKNNNQ